MTVNLPLPPSANALYVQRGRKRVATDAYRAWREPAAIVAGARLGKMPKRTPLGVTIAASASRRRDIDNIIKPTLDMLQEAGVITDDRMVDRVQARRVEGARGTMDVSVYVLGSDRASLSSKSP